MASHYSLKKTILTLPLQLHGIDIPQVFLQRHLVLSPSLLQQFPSHSPHPRLLCTSCSWFYIWWYIQSILCSCLFSLCASFFFSELPVSWDEGLGLLFPVGLRYQEWSWLKVGKIGPHYFKSRWKNRSREDPCQDCTGQGQMSEAG